MGSHVAAGKEALSQEEGSRNTDAFDRRLTGYRRAVRRGQREQQGWELKPDVSKQRHSWGRRCLHWWYGLAAPAEPSAAAPLAVRENARRGRLGSLILLFVTLWGFTAIPTALASKNRFFLPVLTITLLLNILALFLNKNGKTAAAGVLTALLINSSYAITTLNTPNGLSVSSLMNYDMLVESLLIIVTLLPPGSVFFMAFINIACILLDVTFQSRAPDLARLFAQAGYASILRPILLELIVAIVSYLWVRSAIRAIERADRAEEIAALQRNIAEQKRQLDEGIQQILNTHVLAANGNFSTRAPLTQENVLWQIGFSLNNLLARMQRYNTIEQDLQRIHQEAARLSEHLHIRARQAEQSEHEIVRTQIEIGRLTKALHDARLKQTPIWFTTSGTMLDTLIQTLSGNYIGKFMPPLKVNPASTDAGPPNVSFPKSPGKQNR